MHMFLDGRLRKTFQFRFANGWTCSVTECPDGASVIIAPTFIAENPIAVAYRMTAEEQIYYGDDAMRARGDWIDGINDDDELMAIIGEVSVRHSAPGTAETMLADLIAKRRK